MDIEIKKCFSLTSDEVFEAVLQYLVNNDHITLSERDKATYGFFGELEMDDDDMLFSVSITDEESDNEEESDR